MKNINDLTDFDSWNYSGDYASLKIKVGKDKRLLEKAEKKALKAFRDARKNRHN